MNRLVVLVLCPLIVTGSIFTSAALAAPKSEKKTVPVNLAKGKPASASSEEAGKGNVAAKATDGKEETRWCANGPRKGEWLQVDLGAAQRLTGCGIRWESTNNVYRYTVEGSDDGQAWRMIADRRDNKEAGPTTDKFDAAARYLKLTYHGSSAGGWASVWEFAAHGTETETIDVVAVDVTAEKGHKLLAEVKVPDGFEATIFAAPPMANYPVFVAAAPDGTLYVSSDGNGSLGRDPHRGRVLRLRDTDGDGRADEVKAFKDDIDSPRGLVWDHDRLYLMHPPHLSALIDNDGDGIADEQKLLVKGIAFNLKDRPADHTSNGVTLGIDGWLYLAIGDFGFMEAEGTDGRKIQQRGGGVVRVRPDGTGLEIFSRGTRNILEVAVDPLLNGFTRDNTNDGGGWDIRLHHFSGLEHHGYPSLFRNFGDEIVQPLDIYGGGSGCGACYVDEPGFPAGYGNALYTVDWGRSWVYRHRVTPSGATFKADQAEFVSVPRATDMDVDALSRVYVASWRGGQFNWAGPEIGFIARVTPKGFSPEPLPVMTKLSATELVAQLQSPSHRRRMEAQRELVRRGADAFPVSSVKSLAADAARPLAARIAAVFALKLTLRERATESLVDLAADASIREYSLRALTDNYRELANVPADVIAAAAKDANPRVRRQAAESLARLGNTEHAAAIVPLVADTDPIVAHTAINALAELKAHAACFAAVDRADSSTAERAGVLRSLRMLHQPVVVAGLISRLEKETDVTRRLGLISALCRLHFLEGPWKGDSWATRPDTSGPYYQHEAWDETPRIAAALQTAFQRAHGDEAAHLASELARHKIRLDNTLDKMLTLAKQDAKLLPAAVAQLLREPNVPSTALPLLVQAATADGTEPTTRSQAVIALAKLRDADSLRAMLVALTSLDNLRRNDRDFNDARAAFLGSPHLQNHAQELVATAEKISVGVSAWADAALLIVAHSGSSSAEAKAAAGKSLDTGFAMNAQRRVQILEAVRLAQFRPYKPQVLAAMSDKDKAVADAAKRTANELKLFVKTNIKPLGPKLEKIKPEDAIAATVEAKGDPALGEELFLRLNCAKCHTVKQDEAPRGPYLGTIANTYKRHELAESVLLPSKKLAQGFVTQLFVLDDGRTLTGFVTLDAADKVVIRNAEAVEFTIPTKSIEQRVKQTISMMPEGLAKELTVPEFASLIDYIESLAKAKK